MSKTVEIIIFVTKPPCTVCNRAEKVAKKVQKKFGEDKVKIRTPWCLDEEAKKYDVSLAPTVVVGNEIIAEGEVPYPEVLEEVIKENLEAD
ncbi:MAG: thioredoxin family protein [Candidatus Helarchaeota archaeon]